MSQSQLFKNRRAGFAPIAVLLILAVLILGGGVVVYQKVLAPKVNPTPRSTIQPSPTPDPTADWKIYSNKQVGFTFKYPSTWTLSEENVPGTIFHLAISEAGTVPYFIINVRDDIDMESYIKSRKMTGMRQEFTSVGARDASLLTEETGTGGEMIWLVNNYKGELIEIIGTYNSSNKNAANRIYVNLVSTFKFLD